MARERLISCASKRSVLRSQSLDVVTEDSRQFQWTSVTERKLLLMFYFCFYITMNNAFDLSL